ncbi:hypothetical protein CNC01160 [Cryptococcus deneoformans JEC21]|uniref:Uncharacterized protein n=1 Tax=Cryptococcus deneoformans (strain JEC21 / ATCC MYA-565) TaxID=214684 RepID=Q5KL11_CRYD1|nr:hypothetical protein CNC01160 [Cryptococcus neoformans var. neoformans JEC21]AAW42116.1 hypothetical protein CNC01160 [Cryptococcus neoformans var. neoformans JEC21]
MRFTSPDTRPSLTPLGYRLLHLSELKLSSMDGSSYDEGVSLWKGVLVREAVRSAWKSVQDGSVPEMNDWSARGAMGLDIYEEEVEEEEEQQEERWFEDMVTSFGEEEYAVEAADGEHEWVESSVSIPEYDLDFNVDGMEAYTFPASSPSTPLLDDSHLEPSGTVDIIEVDDDESDISDEDLASLAQSQHWHSPSTISMAATSPSTPILFGHPLSSPNSPTLSPVPSPTLLAPTPMPLPAALTGSFVFPDPRSYYTDFEEYVDDFSLPPPLLRSMSSSTTESDVDDGEVCKTPPLRTEELEYESSEEENVKEEELLMGLGLRIGHLNLRL